MFNNILNKIQDDEFYWILGLYSLIGACVVHVLFIFLFLYLEISQLVIVNVGSILLYLYCIFGLAKTTLKTKDDRIIGWLVYFELIGHGIIATYYIGLDSGFQYYFYTLSILPFFTFSYSFFVRMGRIIFVIVVAIFLEVWEHFSIPVVILDIDTLYKLHSVNLLFFLLILTVVSYIYSSGTRKYQNALLQQTNRDPLTNLFNRRFIMNEVKKEIIKEAKKDNQFGILMIDIDHFKQVNDTYGHSCGDKVIVEIAKLLEQTICQTSMVSRWGGEEFLVYLNDIHNNKLELLGEKLRQTIEEHTIIWQDKKIKVTISLGGAVSCKYRNFNEVIVRADNALYEAKNGGRNQVILDRRE